MAEAVNCILERECEQCLFARRCFASWCGPGIGDQANLVHSFGTGYLAGLGFDAGMTALVEVPAPNSGPYGFAGDNVRSDVAWLSAGACDAVALFEFERYSGVRDSAKLAAKVENLVLASHRWSRGQVIVPVLVYWTQGLRSSPDHEALREIARRGFRTAAGEQVAGLRVGVTILNLVCRAAPGTGRWQLMAMKKR